MKRSGSSGMTTGAPASANNTLDEIISGSAANVGGQS